MRFSQFAYIIFALSMVLSFSCGGCEDGEGSGGPTDWNPEICNSEKDEDGDGRISCADSDCFVSQDCVFAPADPMTTRSEVAEIGITSFWDRYAFLFEDDGAIHRGIDEGLVTDENIGVISGRILDVENNPLEGAAVYFANRPEFGRTYTRSDGRYDLVIDGDSRPVIRVSKKGYITSDRRPNTKPFVASGLEEIVLVALQPKATVVDFSESKWVSGEVASDDDGERTTSVYFPKGTKAEMVFPNGVRENLEKMSFHINEVTEGENGRQAMMADLAPRTLYTYAVEFSVKEAIEKNAERVAFKEPVFVYVDNFLDFPAGTIVPSGFYDRDRIAWEAQTDGLVLKIDDIQNGIAIMEFDNGLSEDERRQIAKHYAVGDSFWRVPTKHFSPFDFNWGGPYPPGTNPAPLPGDNVPPDCSMGQEKGSIIGCPTQTLGETVPLNGTPFVLSYRTSRVSGYKAILGVPIKPTHTPLKILVGAKVRVSIAGQTVEHTFRGRVFGIPYTRNFFEVDIPDADYFPWDGRDQFGRLIQGSIEAEVEVSLAYRASYSIGRQTYFDVEYPSSFSINAEVGTEVQLERGLTFIRRRYTRTLTAGTFNVESELGGWTFNVHHRFDPVGSAIYYGDGRDQFASENGKIAVIAGNKEPDIPGTKSKELEPVLNPDGMHAKDYAPGTGSFAVLPNGDIIFIHRNIGHFYQNHALYKIDAKTQMISLFAGEVYDKTPDDFDSTLESNDSINSFQERNNDTGSGGLLKDVRFAKAVKLKMGRDGKLYLLTWGNLWKIENDSATIVMPHSIGHGVRDEEKANPKNLVDGVASDDVYAKIEVFDVALDGTIFYYSQGELFKRTPDGRIRFITNQMHKFGAQENCATLPCAEDDLVAKALFREIVDIAVSDDDEIFIIEKTQMSSDSDRTFVRKISTDGVLKTLSSEYDFRRIDIGPAGELYATFNPLIPKSEAERGAGVGVVEILEDGTIKPRIGSFSARTGEDSSRGSWENDFALRAVSIGTEFDVALNGDIYALTGNQLIKRELLFPKSTRTDFEIPSPSGQEVYVFTKEGIHMKTYEVNTGVVIWSFEYDGRGRLSAIVDRDGDKSTISRDVDGNPVSLTSNNGVIWGFKTAENMLVEVTSPENETHKFSYSKQGLMDSMQTPRGERSEFSYGDTGRLIEDRQPNGGVSKLERDDRFPLVTFTSAEGRQTEYFFPTSEDPNRSTSTTTGEIWSSTSNSGSAWSRSQNQTNIVQTSRNASHPVFGPIAGHADKSFVYLPSGLIGETTTEFEATPAGEQLREGLADWTVTTKNMDRVVTRKWDRALSSLSTTTASGRTNAITFDENARPIKMTSPGLVDTQLEYDTQGRPAKIVRDSREVSFQYNADGYTESVTGIDGSVKFSRDKMGRVLDLERKDSTIAGFTYDPWGYLTSITPPGADSYTMEYDNRGNMTFMNSPNDTRIDYEYDLDHRPTRVVKGDGRDIRISYDSSNRIQQIVSDGEVYDYTYKAYNTNDGLPRVAPITSVSGGAADIAYTWDGPLLKSLTYSGAVSGVFGVEYNDGTLDVKSMDINGTEIELDYDVDGVPIKIGDLNLTYVDETTRLNKRSVGNMSTTFSYNAFGEPETIETSGGLLKEEFVYDGLGRIKKLTRADTNGSRVYDYTYDLLGQIREVKTDGVITARFTYDTRGNRTSTIDVAAGSISYDKDERLERYNSKNYTYNDAGQLKTSKRTRTTSYDYSVTGRLKSVRLESGKLVSYQHDALDRRITRKSGNTITQRFLYGSGLGPIAEVDATGDTITTFVYGTRVNVPDYMIRGGKTYYFVHDYLGSVRAVVDLASGNIEQALDYDVFGRVLSDSNPGYQPFGFAGGLYDHETHLIRFGARDYDAETGRWTAPDPIGFEGGQFNLYVYSDGDAVNFIDPTGKVILAAPFAIALLVGANVGIWSYLGLTPSRCRTGLGAFGWSLGGAVGAAGFYLGGALLAPAGVVTVAGKVEAATTIGASFLESVVLGAIFGPFIGIGSSVAGYATSHGIDPARSVTIEGIQSATASGAIIGPLGLAGGLASLGVVGAAGLPVAKAAVTATTGTGMKVTSNALSK